MGAIPRWRTAPLFVRFGVSRNRKRHPDYRRVKTHRSYSVEETARLYGCHRNTVRNWQRKGLHPIDGMRPAVFDGKAIAFFLQSRRTKRRQSLRSGEIYCLPCRAAKEPAGAMAEYVPLTDKTGNLRGICPTCDRLIHRAVSLAKIKMIQGQLEVTFTDASLRIREIGDRPVNCDLKTEGETR